MIPLRYTTTHSSEISSIYSLNEYPSDYPLFPEQRNLPALERSTSEAMIRYVSRGYDKYKARRKQSYTLETLDVKTKHLLISRKRLELLRASLNATFAGETTGDMLEEEGETQDASAHSFLHSSSLQEARSLNCPWVRSLTHAVLSGFQLYVSAFIEEARSLGRLSSLRNQRDQFGRGPLHYAAYLGELNACRYMLEGGWTLREDSLGRTPMHYAALGNKASVIELILSKPSYQVFDHPSGSVPKIHIDTKTATQILQLSEEMSQFAGEPLPRFTTTEKAVDVQDLSGRTPLHLSVISNSFLAVQALCHSSADPLILDHSGSRPIDLSPNPKITQFLLNHLRVLREKQTSVSYDVRDLELLSPLQLNEGFIGPTKDTYLISAVKQGDLAAVNVLLKKNADFTVGDKDGWTALHVVAKGNRIDLLQFLFEGEAGQTQTTNKKPQLPHWTGNVWQAMDASTNKGYSLLHICALYSTPDVLQYISEMYIRRGRLIAGSKDLPPSCLRTDFKPFHSVIEGQCNKGFTPFLLATREKRLEIMKILVKHNCDVYKKTSLLQNALHLAAIVGAKEAIDYLLYLDSDYNILKNDCDYKARKPKELDTTHHSFEHPWDLVKAGKVEKLLELIRTGKVEVNAGTHTLKNSLLHVALMCKQIFCVRELIKLGANPKLQNAEGLTAFDVLKSLKDSRYELIASRLLAGEANLSTSEISIEQIERLYFRRNSFLASSPIPSSNIDIPFDPDVFYLLQEIREVLLYRKLAISDLYQLMDRNKDFTLSKQEFAGVLRWLGVSAAEDHFLKLIASLDPLKQSRVSYSRLVAHFQELVRREKHYRELDLIFEGEKEAQREGTRGEGGKLTEKR